MKSLLFVFVFVFVFILLFLFLCTVVHRSSAGLQISRDSDYGIRGGYNVLCVEVPLVVLTLYICLCTVFTLLFEILFRT